MYNIPISAKIAYHKPEYTITNIIEICKFQKDTVPWNP